MGSTDLNVSARSLSTVSPGTHGIDTSKSLGFSPRDTSHVSVPYVLGVCEQRTSYGTTLTFARCTSPFFLSNAKSLSLDVQSRVVYSFKDQSTVGTLINSDVQRHILFSATPR